MIPDLHAPAHDEKSLAAVEHYIAWKNTKRSRQKPVDGIIQLGDFQDFNCISSHNANKLRLVEGARIKEDYAVGNRILDRWQNLVKRVDLIEGNHDERIERYVDANPVAAGMLEMDVGLKLHERGVGWTRFWTKGHVLHVGKARFIHGNYTNKYHAEKHVRTYGDNIFYGHCHDVQSYSQEFLGDNKTIAGQSLGCICNYDQGYNAGRPNRWQQAFATFYFLPSGFFHYTVTLIFNHSFVSPEGEYFTPRGRQVGG